MIKSKILLVDDVSSMRSVVKLFLSEGGFHDVTEASNGEQALKQLKLKPFDIIICDWDMPVMDGLELLKKVREDEKMKDIPFIMLTAHNKSDKVKTAIELNVTDFITKPFQAQRLLGKIIKCISI